MHAEIFHPPLTQRLGVVNQRVCVHLLLAARSTCVAVHSSDRSRAHIVQGFQPGNEIGWRQQHVLLIYVPPDGEQFSIQIEPCICGHELMVQVFILWAICLVVVG